MKNLFKLFVPVAAAAIALVSCQPKEEQIGNNPTGEVTIRVHATADNIKAGDQETKTYIDNTNTIIWGTGEYMKLAITAGENTTFANSSADCADSFNGQASATFEFSVTPDQANEYVYQGLYPASAAVASSNTNAANYKVNLPAIQNATASSYDPAAYIMVAKPETSTNVKTEWLASYRRATALNKITLKNVPDGVSFNKIKITAVGKKLAGGRHFNLTTGESSDIYGTDATIEVLYANPLTGTSMDVWFTSWGTEIAEGEKLTIVAYTTDNKSYTKEITARAKGIKFQEGYLNTLGAGMSGIAPEDVTELEPGNYVVLAKDGSNYYALKAEKEEGKERLLSVEYTGDLDSYSGNAALVWTLTKSGNSYVFENDSKYLGYKGSSNESYWLEAGENWTETNYLLDVTAQETAGLYHVTVHSASARYLSKNSSNAFFAFYGNTGQKADIVFVPATALEQVKTPTFNPAAGEVASGTEVTISTATSGATIHYTVDGTDPTSSSASYSSPIAITATTTIKAIAVKDGMADSEIATATYSVASASSVTLTENDITAGSNTVKGTENGQLAYRLGTSNNNGELTFAAGYSSITLRLEAYSNTPRTFSVTNGTINDESSLSPGAGAPSGTINAGFERTDTGTEYTIVVTDSTKPVVFSGRRGIVWGFTAVPAGPAVTWNLNSIEITTPPTTTTYTAGQSFNPAGMVVTGHFVDADNTSNTKDEAVTGYTITPDGALATTDTQVTITYQGKTATQNITVNAAPAGNDGSLEHPYTVAEALAIINGYSDKQKSTSEVYVSGIIANVGSYNGTYHSVTYDISDDGANANTLEIYSGKFVANTNFSSNDQISVNDQVIVYGYLYLYGSTKEMYQNNYIYSLNGKTKALTAGSLTTTPNNANKQITVEWGAATGTESAISYVINCGTQSHNANAAGSYTFTMADYGTYDVSVVASASDALSATAATSATLTDPNASTPTLQYTLDGTDTTQGSNGYATNSEITQSSIGWIAVANTTINPWRFGGKNISGEDRAVYSTTAIDSNISSIEVESGTATATVNSLTITVHNSAADAASGSNAIATKSVTSGITSSTVTLTKTDATSWAGKYYRIVYNVTCGGSNQYVQFKSAKFYGTN